MEYVTLSLLLGGITLFVLYFVNRYNYWKKCGIPQADGIIPFFGHMGPALCMRTSFGQFWTDMYEKYKDRSMVGFYVMKTPALMIREPALVKSVLQTNFQNFHENGLMIDPELDPLLAKNPFFTYGKEWMKGRKQLTHAFSSMRLKILFESVQRVCEQFDNYLQRKLKSSDKYEVELKELFSRFTGQVVAYAGYGIEGLCFEDEESPVSFRNLGRCLFDDSIRSFLATVFITIAPGMAKYLNSKFVPQHVDDHFRRLTDDILRARKSENVARKDVFQLMLDFSTEEGGEVDVEALTAHTFSFFVDGYETSSTTLSFVGYQLAVHQDVQEKLREEVLSILAKTDNKMTYEGLKEMTYMDRVISESQRYYTVLGAMNRKCTEEIELVGSDGLKYRVERGMGIVIPIQGLQSDPKYWPNPQLFDPERFSEDRAKDIEKFTFLPFGEGPRMCPGMRMAMLQMKGCLANLVSKYKLELSPKTKLPIKMSPRFLLTTPVGGFWVHISPL